MKQSKIFILSIVLVLLFISSCKNEEAVIKIGAILPLSGQTSFLGESERNGFELAINEFNSNNNIKIKLITEDSKGDPKEAVTIINKLISVDEVNIVFASLSPVSSAITPIVKDSNILTMLVSVLSPSFAKESENIFKFYPDITQFAQRYSDYLEQNDIKKVALFVYNIEPGEVFIKEFSNYFKGEITNIERFNREDTDFRTQIFKLKSNDPEAILFIAYPQNDIHLLNQLVELDFKPKVMLILANYPNVNSGAAQSLPIIKPISTWYTFSKESNMDFFTKYTQSYGKDPDAEAAYSYDSMGVLLQSLKECESELNCIKTNLKTKSFRGVVANEIKFDRDGNVILPVNLINFDAEKNDWIDLKD